MLWKQNCLVPLRRLPRPSRSNHFGEVSETNGQNLARFTWPKAHRPRKKWGLEARQEKNTLSQFHLWSYLPLRENFRMKQPLLPDKRDAFCLFGMRLTCKRRVMRRRSVAVQTWSVIEERNNRWFNTNNSPIPKNKRSYRLFRSMEIEVWKSPYTIRNERENKVQEEYIK